MYILDQDHQPVDLAISSRTSVRLYKTTETIRARASKFGDNILICSMQIKCFQNLVMPTSALEAKEVKLSYSRGFRLEGIK